LFESLISLFWTKAGQIFVSLSSSSDMKSRIIESREIVVALENGDIFWKEFQSYLPFSLTIIVFCIKRNLRKCHKNLFVRFSFYQNSIWKLHTRPDLPMEIITYFLVDKIMIQMKKNYPLLFPSLSKNQKTFMLFPFWHH